MEYHNETTNEINRIHINYILLQYDYLRSSIDNNSDSFLLETV